MHVCVSAYVCYMLMKEYYCTQNFLFLIESNKKLSLDWFMFKSSIYVKKQFKIFNLVINLEY